MIEVLWWIISILVFILTGLCGLGLKAGLAYFKAKKEFDAKREATLEEVLGKQELQDKLVMEELGSINGRLDNGDAMHEGFRKTLDSYGKQLDSQGKSIKGINKELSSIKIHLNGKK